SRVRLRPEPRAAVARCSLASTRDWLSTSLSWVPVYQAPMVATAPATTITPAAIPAVFFINDSITSDVEFEWSGPLPERRGTARKDSAPTSEKAHSSVVL